MDKQIELTDLLYSSLNENENNKINEEEKTILKFFHTSRLLISSIHKKDTNKIIEDMLIQMTDSPFPLKHNNIEIRKSKIHGNVVFATSDIEKNTIVTFYPAHCIICDDNKDVNGIKTHIFPNKKFFEVNKNYMINVNEKYSIIGNPLNTNKSLLLGHIINDSKSFKIDTEINNETWENIKNKISEYLLESNNNCISVHNKES